MARFLVAVMPFTGHVTPLSAVARELVARGHDVRCYSGGAFADRLRDTGARFLPWRAAPDFDEQDLAATFPRLVGAKGLAQVMVNMEDLFIGTAPGQVEDLRAAWDDGPWDVLVAEELSIGPRLAAEAVGCRAATVAIGPLTLPSRQGPPAFGVQRGRTPVGHARDAALRVLAGVFARRLGRSVADARVVAGLPAAAERYDRAVFSPLLVLATGVPALDHDRTDRPASVRFVGRLAHAAPGTPPAWWGDLDGRRVVHVTQGTQNTDPGDLLRPAIEALAGRDVLVVATTGVRGVTALPFPVGRDVRVADFIPHDLLLPRTDVMVTNGGWGGVLAALAHGVPLVVAGGDLDKPAVAARVAESGAGVDLRTGRPTALAVRTGFDRVSADPRYRAAAGRLAGELAAAGGVQAAADALEALAA